MNANPLIHNNTIMIVDDDDGIREALKAALEYEGYKVCTAENGQVALDLLNQGAQPCLIVLDLMMPVMDGWTFAAKLAASTELSNIPIFPLLLSAHLEIKPNRFKPNKFLKNQ